MIAARSQPHPSPDLAEASTFVQLLTRRAVEQPNRRCYTFLGDGESEEDYLTYSELDRRARAIAALLQDITIPGDRALLLYPSGLEYISAFFGCLYANVVAVPAYPPRRNKPNPAFRALLLDARPTVALSTRRLLANLGQTIAPYSDCSPLHWIPTDEVPANLATDWHEPAPNGETLAFLQYTSGSTGNPKGVMISHANLLHNQRMIRQSFGHTERTTVAGWLPLFHDMGLIGNVLQSMYLGVPCILMSPVSFLQRPYRWLQAISRYKVTTSGAPNFAYELCVRKVAPEQVAELDLSSWQVAFCGSELVREETLDRFALKFAAAGFRRESFYPCYGLAEATLFVSGRSRTEAPALYAIEYDWRDNNCKATSAESSGRTLVSCGRAWDSQQICIVNPATFRACPDGEVGEIWVRGASIAKGYWNRPLESKDTFEARLTGFDGGPFLRTGDLGFLRANQLFVTGRLKDMIVIRGRNYYPQDIEAVVQDSHPALEQGRGAAFSIEHFGEERLVIAQDVSSSWRRAFNQSEVTGNIREAVANEFGLELFAVSFLKSGGTQRTSSGKIQRHACRAQFLNNTLDLFDAYHGSPERTHPFPVFNSNFLEASK